MEQAVRLADNLAEFARRGGRLSAGARLLLVRCVHCRHPYLYDEGHDRLYLDPEDLRSVWECTDVTEPPSCAGCGKPSWCFEDVTADEVDGCEGWRFCFWSPPTADEAGRRRAAVAVMVGVLGALGVASLVANPDPFAPPRLLDSDLSE